MSVQVVAEFGTGVFAIQERPLEWCCEGCLGPVLDSGFGYFECECGPAFVVSVVSYSQDVILVRPEVPWFEPKPEA